LNKNIVWRWNAMLFYFTGTGNSLYVAKRLEKSPISIPQAIHDSAMQYKDECI
jgi:hypothetical protein